MSHLLTAESPLVLLPSLAAEFGVVEAVFLQQLHYWQAKSDITHDGKKYVYNTLEQWHSQLYCFSQATLKRAIARLQKIGIVIIEKLAKHKSNRTNFYHLDLTKLAHIAEFSNAAIDQKHQIKLSQTTAQNDPIHQDKLNQPTAQNDLIHQRKMTQSISSDCTNGYTETTKENPKNTSKKKTREFLKNQKPNIGEPKPLTDGTPEPTHSQPSTEQLASIPIDQRQLWQQLRQTKLDIAIDDPRLKFWLDRNMLKSITQTLIDRYDGHWHTPDALNLPSPITTQTTARTAA